MVLNIDELYNYVQSIWNTDINEQIIQFKRV